MTHITADQAKTLIADAEHTGRWYADYDDEADATRLYDRDEDKDEDEEITDGGSWTLAAAAPDLARTVIAQAEKIEALRCSYQQYERFLERFYKDFAKALGREDLLGAAEDGSEDDGQTIYELSLDAVYKAREAGLVYKAREADQ